jgi:tRNA pseudouridine55 synthase
MNNDILPFWQEIGTSTSIIARRVSEKLHSKTSHTGTLDPLASGVVLILKGDEYFNKEKYIQNYKTYNFDILFGFSTDTHDALGIIEKSITEELEIDEKKLNDIINSMIGKYHQQYPDFSSKKVEGRSLWEYKRLGLPVPNVFIDGEILEIKTGKIMKISSENEINNLIDTINSISGNFRQEEIVEKYQSLKVPPHLFRINLEVVMSRGMYVRGLVRDICNNINIPGIVTNLVRTKDGEFSKADCQTIKEYFKEELAQNPKFLNPEFRNL